MFRNRSSKTPLRSTSRPLRFIVRSTACHLTTKLARCPIDPPGGDLHDLEVRFVPRRRPSGSRTAPRRHRRRGSSNATNAPCDSRSPEKRGLRRSIRGPRCDRCGRSRRTCGRNKGTRQQGAPSGAVWLRPVRRPEPDDTGLLGRPMRQRNAAWRSPRFGAFRGNRHATRWPVVDRAAISPTAKRLRRRAAGIRHLSSALATLPKGAWNYTNLHADAKSVGSRRVWSGICGGSPGQTRDLFRKARL